MITLVTLLLNSCIIYIKYINTLETPEYLRIQNIENVARVS